jgi:hypothetical protein
MTQWRTNPSATVRSLLELERQIAPLPEEARERFMVKARATLVAMGGVRSLPPMTRRIVPWAAALVGMVCLGSAAGGFAAYRWCFRRPTAAVRVDLVPKARAADLEERAPVNAATEVLPEALLLGLPIQADEARDAQEIGLLEQARAAVARNDFAGSLEPLAVHARRFKHGRLAEEREALRIRALVGLGRHEEVRRAAAAFRTRFPRSLLVPIVNQLAASGS